MRREHGLAVPSRDGSPPELESLRLGDFTPEEVRVLGANIEENVLADPRLTSLNQYL